jgi:predicted RNase H-like HicB family nuclease
MEGLITLHYQIEQEGDDYVATCQELDVSSFGSSVEDAVRHLEDAIALYLRVTEEDGELDQVFRDRNITVQRAGGNGSPRIFTTTGNIPLPV